MQNLTKTHIEHLLAIDELRKKLGSSIEGFVSFSANSVPTAGSHAIPLSSMNETEVFKSLKSIRKHKTGDITLFTTQGNIRLWRSETDKLYEIALKTGPALMARLRA